jgi:catechol 2,3-dioxygenase-like lactoylglutathione lyase family enzyme
MKIVVTHVFVDDQQKALDFYTEVLGFKKKQDVPGGEFRWLTVVSSSNRAELNCSWNQVPIQP